MWSQQFSAKIYSNLKACLVIQLLPILMGNTLNYNYNSAITNKNSNHCTKSCFSKAIFYGCWSISLTQWSESIHWKGQDKIHLYSFFHNTCNLKLMSYRAIMLQVMKIPVINSRLGSVRMALRASLPAWETDWT